jgi:hypothetical protein
MTEQAAPAQIGKQGQGAAPRPVVIQRPQCPHVPPGLTVRHEQFAEWCPMKER